ncbi:hypothetical protein B0T26DRAFT_676499 [Lasiosphaeria miniovina]|uniref:Uncharacterized protein n=1 Tax=Lasiosphaeria miniovina TaxID=1954250 RepID=A0AA40AM10_9PEZI|nr:uncharacterized protein B0T26DRAFT_676499 [Lasiosphaeria miniovina]KAK0718321.1 hypothetical protein B0T26DRAFT_676499 [Lasiosphaeria miniovina]
MKSVTLIVSALAAMVSAAPAAVEKKSNFDLSQLNNLNNFNQVNLNYLLNINQLQLQQLGFLGQNNNFNILGYQNLFSSNQFDLASLLQLQQLQTLLQFQQVGLFSNFDLSSLDLQLLQLGLLNNVGSVDLSQFIQPTVVSQVQTIASQAPFALGSGFLPGGGSASANFAAPVPAASFAAPAPAAVVPSASDSEVVTDAEQNAQEGGSSLNRA